MASTPVNWDLVLLGVWIMVAIISGLLILRRFFVETFKKKIDAAVSNATAELNAEVSSAIAELDTKVTRLANGFETLETKNSQQRKDMVELGKKVDVPITYIG